MTKQFYIQVDEVNRITDVVEMPHEGYQPVELAVPLPPGILGGAYELVGGSPIYRIQWDTKISIHALLTEGDLRLPVLLQLQTNISIHALLTEGDVRGRCLSTCPGIFQSTPSSRRVTLWQRHPVGDRN